MPNVKPLLTLPASVMVAVAAGTMVRSSPVGSANTRPLASADTAVPPYCTVYSWFVWAWPSYSHVLPTDAIQMVVVSLVTCNVPFT